MSPKKTVLVVEDEAFQRDMLYDRLKPDYEVLLAKNGIEGIYCYEDHAEEIIAVITDWEMPHINGAQRIKCLRFRDANLPLILLTGNWPEEKARSLEEEFAKEGVALAWKPFDVGRIKDLLAGIIR